MNEMVDMINITKLVNELLIAGLPVCSVREAGLPVADYTRALTAAEQVTAAAVIAAHDPAKILVPSLDERIVALEKRNKALEALVEILAVTQFGAASAVEVKP